MVLAGWDSVRLGGPLAKDLAFGGRASGPRLEGALPLRLGLLLPCPALRLAAKSTQRSGLPPLGRAILEVLARCLLNAMFLQRGLAVRKESSAHSTVDFSTKRPGLTLRPSAGREVRRVRDAPGPDLTGAHLLGLGVLGHAAATRAWGAGVVELAPRSLTVRAVDDGGQQVDHEGLEVLVAHAACHLVPKGYQGQVQGLLEPHAAEPHPLLADVIRGLVLHLRPNGVGACHSVETFPASEVEVAVDPTTNASALTRYLL